MSHVAVQETKPGQPMFSSLAALQMACGQLGLEIEERSNYEWYGHHVGDYPVPEGMSTDQMGKNAKYVLKLNAEKAAAARKKHGRNPYEIGILEDPNNPGCYLPMYDFWGGGYGLDDVVGAPLFNKGKQSDVKMLCPTLKQHYDMCCDAMAAKKAGDKIEFLTMKDAHIKYPKQFAKSEDTKNWVSIANTGARLGK